MKHEVSHSTAQANKGFVIVDEPGQFNHRGLVLGAVCDLETEFADWLFAFFSSRNSNITKSRADKELFSENGLLGSLSRMSKMAYYLGLICDDELHDFRVLVRLRNKYAHGKNRDQFYRDAETSKLVRDLRLHKNSASVFTGFDDQGVFLSCYAHLRTLIIDRRLSL